MLFSNFWNIIWIPVLLLLLLLVYLFRRRREQVRFSSIKILKDLPVSRSLFGRHLLVLLRGAALVLLIIALMRPREGLEKTHVETEGIDIVLSLDVSGSMKAEDFTISGRRRNRSFVVREVVREFIAQRKNDRIGIVIFGGKAYTLCPLTSDQGILLQFLERAEAGMVEDGTAIGEGITTALNRLRPTKTKSKIIILLTDGVQNAGKIDPKTAAELARTLHIKLYTIGVGSKGAVPFPMQDPFGRTVYQPVKIDLDDALLKSLAETTGGLYFRATDTEALKEIYQRIDQLEKTKIEATHFMQYRELFSPLIWAALWIVLLEGVLAETVLRTLP